MKFGYSVLISEFVEASILDYTDCKEFQVICPECKEPVYKKVKNINGKDIHFLSHFNITDSNKECELRVASYTIEQIKKYNNISRKQKLEEFINHIPSLFKEQYKFKFDLLKSNNCNDNLDEIIKQLEKSNELKKFVNDATLMVTIGEINNVGIDSFFKTDIGKKIITKLVILQLAINGLFFRFIMNSNTVAEIKNQILSINDEDNHELNFYNFCSTIVYSGELKKKITLDKAKLKKKGLFYKLCILNLSECIHKNLSSMFRLELKKLGLDDNQINASLAQLADASRLK